MKFKAIFIFVIIAIAVILIGLFLFNMVVEVEQRKTLEHVQIEFVDITLSEIGITSLELGVSIDMYNPNEVTATLDRASYEVWFNDNKLGSGTIDHLTDIPPYTSRQIKTDFTISYAQAGETVITALTEEQHQWRIKGVAHYDTALGTMNIPFDLTR